MWWRRLASCWAAILATIALAASAAAQSNRLANYTVLLDSPAAGQRLIARPGIDLSPGQRVAASDFVAEARAVATAQEPVIEALEAGGGRGDRGSAECAERDIHPC